MNQCRSNADAAFHSGQRIGKADERIRTRASVYPLSYPLAANFSLNNTMAAVLTADVLQDDIAVSLARAIAAANKRARESGVDVLESIITITQRAFDGSSLWEINYGPKEYIGRRGGDFMVKVDPSDSSIKQVQRGQ